MAITERSQGTVTILDLPERFREGEGTDELGDAIDRLIQQGIKQIVVNLKGLAYTDDSGVQAFLRASITVKNAGGVIKLVQSPRVGLFSLQGWTKMLILLMCSTPREKPSRASRADVPYPRDPLRSGPDSTR